MDASVITPTEKEKVNVDRLMERVIAHRENTLGFIKIMDQFQIRLEQMKTKSFWDMHDVRSLNQIVASVKKFESLTAEQKTSSIIQ